MAGIVCSVILNIVLFLLATIGWKRYRKERLRTVTLISFLVHAHKGLLADNKQRAFRQLVELKGRMAQFLQAVQYEEYIPKLRTWKYTVKQVRRK
jgi:hypothetical protein